MFTQIFQSIQSLILAVIMLFIQSTTCFYAPAADEVAALKEKTDGFIFGICHPKDGEYDHIQDIGFSWVRIDIPYPFKADGSLSSSYLKFKKRCKNYTEHGMKVMAITPYPKDYVNIGGFYPTDEEHQQKTKEIAVFLINDLREVIDGIQVSNELGGGSSTYPLTEEESALFIGIQLEVLNDIKGDIIVGYNTAGEKYEFHQMLKPYVSYCDYVGLDMYYDDVYEYIKTMRKIYRLTRRPILIQEFGRTSAGRPKTQEEKIEILQQYGYQTEEEARADIVNLVSKLPTTFQDKIKQRSPDPSGWSEAVFEKWSNHFYRQSKYRTATPQEQAEYFAKVMPVLLEEPYLAGMMVYCYRDTSLCYFCRLEGCPEEISYGLTDIEGNPKPACDVIQKVIADYNSSQTN